MFSLLPGVNPSANSVDVGGILVVSSPPAPIPADVAAVIRDWGWFNSTYSYFGRVDIWKSCQPHRGRKISRRNDWRRIDC